MQRLSGLPGGRITSADPAQPYGDRVLRGGSWLDRPAQLHFACRQIYPQDEHNDMVGFQVALTL